MQAGKFYKFNKFREIFLHQMNLKHYHCFTVKYFEDELVYVFTETLLLSDKTSAEKVFKLCINTYEYITYIETSETRWSNIHIQ